MSYVCIWSLLCQSCALEIFSTQVKISIAYSFYNQRHWRKMMASKDGLQFLWNLCEYWITVNLIDSLVCFYVEKAHEVAPSCSRWGLDFAFWLLFLLNLFLHELCFLAQKLLENINCCFEMVRTTPGYFQLFVWFCIVSFGVFSVLRLVDAN